VGEPCEEEVRRRRRNWRSVKGGREERQENPASLEKVYSCRLVLRVLYVHPALYTSSLEANLQDVLYLDRFFKKFCAKMLDVGSIFYMLSSRGIFSMLSTLYRRHFFRSVYHARSIFILQSA
jgi:hypothetical protein